jgi:hypothetical protein
VKRSTPIELDGEDLRRSPSEYALRTMPSGLAEIGAPERRIHFSS